MGRLFKTYRLLILSMIAIIVLAVLSLVFIYLVSRHQTTPIRSDGLGYYQYLPAFFDYHDMSFSFIEEPSGVWRDAAGNIIDKYPVGVAMLEFPFFIVVDIFLKIFHPELADGFSTPYQITSIVSTLVYFIIGMIATYRALSRHFDKKIAYLTLVLICFGTNLFHYATYDSCFSHIYSFCIIALFVLTTDKIEEYSENRGGYSTCSCNFLILGILLGLIFILRNPNVVIVFYFVCYGAYSVKELIGRIKKLLSPKVFLPFLVGGAIGIMPQLIYWHHTTGKWIIRSYSAEETFSWLFPHIMNGLFSINKGMLFWSPVLALSLIGMLLLRKYELPAMSIWMVILFHMYITLSWDCWFYGGSFGQRPFVDMYVLYAICLASMLKFLNDLHLVELDGSVQKVSISALRFISPILILFVIMNMKAMLGYWQGIIPFAGSTMTDINNLLSWDMSDVRTAILDYIKR